MLLLTLTMQIAKGKNKKWKRGPRKKGRGSPRTSKRF